MKMITRYILLSAAVLLISSGCDRLTGLEDRDDYLAPAAPSDIRVEYAADGEILLSWERNREPDFDQYIVRRSDGDTLSFREILRTRNNYLFNDSLDYDLDYFYRIVSLDDQGRESGYISTISVKPENRFFPYRPRNFAVRGRNWMNEVSIEITWDVVTESDVVLYEIHRTETSDFEPDSSSLLATTNRLSWSDRDGIEFYERYYYKVISVDKGGLKSNPTPQDDDIVLPAPEPVFPAPDTKVGIFSYFLIQPLEAEATYEVVLQDNPLTGERWANSVTAAPGTEEISVPLTVSVFSLEDLNYWRIQTYTKEGGVPNSISEVYRFSFDDEF